MPSPAVQGDDEERRAPRRASPVSAGPGVPAEQRDSRVLVFSQRNVLRPTWHTAQYEFEDLIAAWDDVVLLAPPEVSSPWLSSLSRHAVNGAAHQLGRRRRSPPWVQPSMARARVVGDHDLFVGIFHHSYQLSYLHRLKGWRERCTKAVCLLIEQWSPDIEDNADYLAVLQQFDEVYVCNPAVGPGFVRLGLRPPRFMAPGLDAVLFSPVPQMPPRVIDAYTYGRTAPLPHASMLRLVEGRGLTYLYDALADSSVRDHVQHRAVVANMMKRSKFFFAFRINDSPERRERTGCDEALTPRYFEAAAGGALVLGSRTRSAEFDECFDWEDAVLPLDYDETDVATVLDELSQGPERLARARTASVRNSLLRHDWVYRWLQLLEAVDLTPSTAAEVRVQHLQTLASAVDLPGEPVRRVVASAEPD